YQMHERNALLHLSVWLAGLTSFHTKGNYPVQPELFGDALGRYTVENFVCFYAHQGLKQHLHSYLQPSWKQREWLRDECGHGEPKLICRVRPSQELRSFHI